jgi:hypothetical protein
MPHQIATLAREFVRAFALRLKEGEEGDVTARIGDHLEAVLYNVTSVSVIFALLQGATKIERCHLGDVAKYITAACPAGPQRGGGDTSMPSDYFGYPHPAYDAGHAGEGAAMAQVQFDAGVARAGLDSQLGGAEGRLRLVASHSAEAKRFVKTVLAIHDMKISKTGLALLLRIVDIHLNCFAGDLAKHAPLTPAKLARVVALKRHAVFH